MLQQGHCNPRLLRLSPLATGKERHSVAALWLVNDADRVQPPVSTLNISTSTCVIDRGLSYIVNLYFNRFELNPY